MQVFFVAVQHFRVIAPMFRLLRVCGRPGRGWHNRLPMTVHHASPTSQPLSAPARPAPQPRQAYAVLRPITTRWMDNDVYGHVNNVVYYSWFDTAVNAYLIEQGALDIHHGESIGLVIETQCNYFAPVAFPQDVEVGIRVAHRGKSSVRYEVGIFVVGEAMSAACGHFIHVYVDRESRRPVELPAALQAALQALLVQ